MSNEPEESIFGRFSPEVIEMILTNLRPGSLKNAGSVDKYAKSVYESEAFWLSKYVRDIGNPSLQITSDRDNFIFPNFTSTSTR